MRKKSITLLVCVYAALCISYTVVSSAMVPDSDDMIQTVSQDSTSTIAQSSSSDNSSGTAKEKSSVADTESSKAVDSNSAYDNNDIENEVIETTDNSDYENEDGTADIESYGEEDISSDYGAEEQDADSGIANEIPEQITESYDSDEDSQEQIEEEDEYAQDKPTLEDYLRGLRCSGCRHNCSLLSPRCMNGARKASQAESAYYEAYGT